MITAQKEQIAKRAGEIIFANEGNYGSVNKNDNGAVSVGKIQWHGNRAKALLRIIIDMNKSAAKSVLGDNLYSEIMSSKSWSARTVSSVESTKLSLLLKSIQGQQAQDELALNDVLTYINKGISYGLTNEEALIYFADGVNQYGIYSTLWKNITTKALQNGGTLDAMYNATKSLTSSYMTRRRTVYTKLKLGSDEPNQPQVQPKPANNIFVSIQKWLNNYCKAGLVVDGDCGPKTRKAMVKALQHYMNTEKGQSLEEDGSFGPKTTAASKCLEVSSSVNRKGNLAYIVQAMLYAKGYNPNGFDGECGPGYTNAIKAFQKAAKISVDGCAGPITFAKLVQ